MTSTNRILHESRSNGSVISDLRIHVLDWFLSISATIATSGSAAALIIVVVPSDKVAAINQFTAETGVTAFGSNALKVTLDFDGSSLAEHDDFRLDGIEVNLSTAVSMDLVVARLNAGVAGKSNTVASTQDGFLILSNKSLFDIR